MNMSLNEHISRQDAAIEQHDKLEAEAEEMADDFRLEAMQQMFKDYGFDGEIFTHWPEQVLRLVMWIVADNPELNSSHPYYGPGGVQMRIDDMTAIRQQRNGWLNERASGVRDEWIKKELAA